MHVSNIRVCRGQYVVDTRRVLAAERDDDAPRMLTPTRYGRVIGTVPYCKFISEERRLLAYTLQYVWRPSAFRSGMLYCKLLRLVGHDRPLDLFFFSVKGLFQQVMWEFLFAERRPGVNFTVRPGSARTARRNTFVERQSICLGLAVTFVCRIPRHRSFAD